MYLIHASTSSFSSMGSTSIAITREHTTRVGLGATAQTRQKRTLAAPPPQRPSPLGMSFACAALYVSPKVNTMHFAAAASRGARRGSAAAVRWISAPRAGDELRRAGVHTTVASANANAAPQPQSSDGQQHIPSPACAALAPDPRRRSRAGARAPQQRVAPQNHVQNNWQQQQRAPQQQRNGVARGGNPGAPPAQRPLAPPPPPAFRSTLPDDIDAMYHQMQHLGSKWADLHAEAELLEESKKCVLATITLHYMNDGDNKSAGEAKAFAAPEYLEHVRKMVEARRKANQAKVEFEGIKTHMNLTRTYEASRRGDADALSRLRRDA